MAGCVKESEGHGRPGALHIKDWDKDHQEKHRRNYREARREGWPLLRAGMSRDFVKELRGDTSGEAIDIYNHIDKKELRESYLVHIPQLSI
jgi:hypothetical protein